MSTLNIAIAIAGQDQGAGALISRLAGGLGDLGSVAVGIGAAGLAAAAVGVGALAAGLGFCLSEAMGAQEVMAQTEAVIHSTGGAAGMTAQQVADLATALSTQSRFSDDAIQTGENLLLTFTNIGADVFPGATQAMVDMAAAMGTDVKGGAVQLGKALNDPIAGISALSRVGVTFTEDQKAVIKSLVETGDVAGAQQIILAELNKEFGGSAAAAAETFAGKLDVMKNRLLNVAEAIGGPLLDMGMGLIDKFIMPVIPLIEEIGNAFAAFISILASGDIGGAFDALGEFDGLRAIFQGLGIDISGVGAIVEDFFAALASNDPQAFFDTLNQAFTSFAGFVGSALQGIVTAIQTWIVANGPAILATLQAWGQAFVDWIAPMIPPLLAKAQEMATQLLAWVVAQVPLWIAQLAAWGQAFVDWIAPQIPPLLAKAQDLGAQLLAWVQAQVPVWLAQLQAWGEQFVAWVGPQIPPLLAKAAELGSALYVWIAEQVTTLEGKFLEWAAELVAWIGPQIPPMLAAAGEFLGAFVAWLITTGVPALVENMKDWAAAMIDWIATDLIPKIGPGLLTFLTEVTRVVRDDLLPGFVTFGKNFVSSLLEGLGIEIPNVMGNLATLGTNIIEGIKSGVLSAAAGLIAAVTGSVGDAIAAAKALLGIASPSKVFAGIGMNMMQGMALGIRGAADLPALATANAAAATTYIDNRSYNVQAQYGYQAEGTVAQEMSLLARMRA